jgi:uncharacterized protein YcbX
MVSEMLGFECKLVKITTTGARKHNSTKLDSILNVSLADGYPYLLIGSQSLDFLNEKLKAKISMVRFRPNIRPLQGIFIQINIKKLI